MRPMDLRGAVVIVTGSSSGIGAACVRRLAAKGCNVVVNYSRSADAAAAVAEECRALGAKADTGAGAGTGAGAIAVQADVSDDAGCRRLAAAAMDEWGRLDGLVNNAGTTKFCDHADLDGLSADDFQAIYAVNVVGPYQMSRAAAAVMERGAIVNVASMAGVMGIGSSIAYAASKGALNTMTLSLARVLGPRIRVNAVCPGFVQGEWLRNGLGAERYDSMLRHLTETNALGAPGGPDDIAEAAVWFLEGASRVTGEIMMVDSGFHLSGAPLKAR